MKPIDYLTWVLPRIFYYAAARRGLAPPINPLTLTFSVTSACQCRCLTCNIGTHYLEASHSAKTDLDIDEIETVFKSLGRIYFFNVSGGEPFMRKDLAKIVRLACMHLKPRLIHIPTNATLPQTIAKITPAILEAVERYATKSTLISIKPSIDGLHEEHDRIRGFEGNFALLEKSIDVLQGLSRSNPRLHVDLGTVISIFNMDQLDEIEDWVHARGIESYRHELAWQRAEFHNQAGERITPFAEDYAALAKRFKAKILSNIKAKSAITRMTEAVRLVYYDLAVRILREKRQVTPCLGGISNIHLNYDGRVWPCCVLGDDQGFGNVRDGNYNLKKILDSDKARKARTYIKEGRCACPMANQWLNNILLTPRHMLKVLKTLIFFS